MQNILDIPERSGSVNNLQCEERELHFLLRQKKLMNFPFVLCLARPIRCI